MNRFVAVCGLALALPAHGVELEWSFVGHPGNPSDSEVMTCCGSSLGSTGYGAVAYPFFISRTEITNAQYAEFLNAVAVSDANRLFDPYMQTDEQFGGITQSGTPGHRRYAVKPGFEDKPVTYVTFHDALRFANWPHNGQPATGTQRRATTEDGAYTLADAAVEANTVVRNPGARYFLTSEDEWFKAAYYDPDSGSYFDYATSTDEVPACVTPDADDGNAANYCTLALSDVGAYGLSLSAFGTFDQSGNVFEWNEAIIDRSADGECGSNPADELPLVPLCRGTRGGHYGDMVPVAIRAAYRYSNTPDYEAHDTGFRVATVVPEPALGLLFATGLLVLLAARLPGLLSRTPSASWGACLARAERGSRCSRAS